VAENVMIRSRTGAALAALALAGALLPACGRRAASAKSPAVVDTAGIQQRVADAQAHPLLLVFWATWCKPCVEELPGLVTLQNEAPQGLNLIAVSLDHFLSGPTTPQVVADWLQTHPVPLQHLIYAGTQDALFNAFDLSGSIPYAILYDAQGRVLKRYDGQTEPAAVRTALAAAATGS
jgi:thiol-disulfide isomerase/thioredoxin